MPDQPLPTSSDSSTGDAGAPAPAPVKPRAKRKSKTKKLPPFNVILLNDDDHTYEYVIAMLSEIFAHPPERGYQIAKTVDKDGKAIVLTTHKELAELKLEQILAYGTDTRVATCKGSMSAVIEPAN